MSKANAPCPCGSKKKYKKCCKKKGLYTKKSEVPSMWKNLGQSHPSFRFSIGDRIETDLDDPNETQGHPQWIPGTIRGFNPSIGAYDILLDYPVGKFRLDAVSLDTNNFTRPFGFTKSATHKTDPCAACGLNEPTDGSVTFVQCGDCRRTRYCTPTCQRTDWKKHRVQCQAIVAQNKRVSIEIKELIKTGKSEAIQNALFDAIIDNDFVITRKLLKKRGEDVNIDAVYSSGEPLLYIASKNGNIGTVKLLIQAGSNVNQAETTMSASPLFIASQKGNVDLVKVLIKAGSNVNQARSTDGCSPLFMASQNGNIDTVKVLIKAGGNVNQATTDDGRTPLWQASQEGYVDLMKVLIQEGGNVNQALTTDGVSALYIASHQGNIDAVKVLIAAGSNVNQATTDGKTPLLLATKTGRVDIVKIIIEAGGDVNQVGDDGMPPLAKSCALGKIEIVRLLLQQPAIDVNKNEEKWSPLYATEETVLMLLDQCLMRQLFKKENLDEMHRIYMEIKQLLKDAGPQSLDGRYD